MRYSPTWTPSVSPPIICSFMLQHIRTATHIGTGDTIVRLYSPDRVYLLPYDDSYIYNTARLWDNLYVYDQLLTAAEETEGVTLIQHLNPGAASAEEGSPDFAFGNFQIQIVNYEEDYLTSPKEDANQFCLGVIASANDHRAFLTSDIDDVEGDASRIVSNYGLYSIDLMTSNHHGYPNASMQTILLPSTRNILSRPVTSVLWITIPSRP